MSADEKDTAKPEAPAAPQKPAPPDITKVEAEEPKKPNILKPPTRPQER